MGESDSEGVRIGQFKQLPRERQQRSCKNVFCLVVGIVFTLTVLIIAAILFKNSTFYMFLYPTDSDGKICGYDYPNYPFLYFSAAPTILPRVCVSRCPVQGDLVTACQPNSLVTSCSIAPLSNVSNTYAQKTGYGDFCWPVNVVLANQIQNNANMLTRIQFFQSMDAVGSTLIFVLIISIIFFFIAQCISQFLNYVIIPVCVVVIVFSINLIFTFSTTSTGLREALAIFMIVIAVLIVLSIYKNCYSTRLLAIFLKASTQVVSNRKRIVLYILLFLILLILFIGIILFEFVGYWSNGRKIFIPAQYVYYKLQGLQFSTLIVVILSLQLIWGIAFLRQTFYYCLAGNAIHWYFQQSDQYQRRQWGVAYPLWIFLTKNFGTTIACSFMTGYFSLFDQIYDMIKPVDEQSCYNSCFHSVFGWFHYLGDLVRSDSLTIDCLVGSSYWDGSLYAQQLVKKAPLTEYYQFSSRVFSLSAHFFIMSLAIIYSMYFPKITSIEALTLVMAGSMIIATFFVSFHEGIAQSLQILYHLDQESLNIDKREFRLKTQNDGVSCFRSSLAIEVHAVYFEENVPAQ